MGLATAAELDELDAAARAHLDDPDTVVMSGLLFLTWGRKPDHAPGDSVPGTVQDQSRPVRRGDFSGGAAYFHS